MSYRRDNFQEPNVIKLKTVDQLRQDVQNLTVAITGLTEAINSAVGAVVQKEECSKQETSGDRLELRFPLGYDPLRDDYDYAQLSLRDQKWTP